MLNIGWFSTGRDEAARQLLQAVQSEIHSGGINGKISFVFSNREPSEAKESDLFFELVQGYDIPLVCFSHKKFKTLTQTLSLEGRGLREGEAKQSQEDWRLQYDREVNKRIEPFAPDICVLAGYMLIVGKEMCKKYKMINLHPAPFGGPTGSWQEVIWALIQSKAEEAGAMMHLVTPELDRGPPITYYTFPIRGEPFDKYWEEIKGYPVKDIKERQGENNRLFQLIRQHELVREFPLIIFTLQALSQGKVSIREGKVIDARRRAIDGYDLGSKINEAIESNIASVI